MKASSNVPATVKDYLSAQPAHIRATLDAVRKAVLSVCPGADEKISYQIPNFIYLGPLVAYAVFKNHCGFYIMSHAVVRQYATEINDFDTSGITIRFPHDKPLPAALVRKLVLARMMENEERERERQEKKGVQKKKAAPKKAALKTKTPAKKKAARKATS